MANIHQKLTELIGGTPLVRINELTKDPEVKAEVVAKLEYFNPGGSVKDRIALAMIEDAEKSGKLKPGATIIEPTSGNTGVGIAWVAVVKGYKAILTMPESMSEEHKNLLRARGAQLVHEQIPGSIILQQFDNPANRAIHEKTTAEEIWKDTDGKVDIVVGGVGTGGTISGIAAGLKKHNPDIKAFAVEPDSSPILSGGNPGPHKIQGIGANFIPGNFVRDLIDGVIRVKDNDAIKTGRELALKEGLLVGISFIYPPPTATAAWAALDLAKKPENAGKRIIAILPDTGERYLSTVLYAFEKYPL